MRHRRWLSIVLALTGLAGSARADFWRGCVEVANTSGIDVTATIDGYPNWEWSAPGSDSTTHYLRDGSMPIMMQADSHARPPIHFQPGNIGMLWNFFTGVTDPNYDQGCKDFWRIVVIRSPCSNVVDNLCR